MEAVRQTATKCSEDGNDRFAKVFHTGDLIHGIYGDDQFAFAFTGKKPIHFPGVGYLDAAKWNAMKTEEMVNELIQMLQVADQHGYLEVGEA